MNNLPKPGVTFIVIDDDKILMQLRDEHSPRFPNTWCFPGATCDEGETFEETALRELHEEFELGVNPEDLELIAKRDEGRTWTYVTPLPEGQEPVMHEGADMAWMTLDQIRRLDLGYNHVEDVLPLVEKYFSR